MVTERWLHGALTLALAPVLLLQGRWVRHRTPRLPEPPGPRSGVVGQGPVLRLLILGDSSAAGVGAAHQDEALSGRLTQALSGDFTVHWTLLACTGHKMHDAVAALQSLAPQPLDVVVTALGANDATGGTRSAQWLQGLQVLEADVRERFEAPHLVLSALPPMHCFPALPQPLRWYMGRCAHRLNRAQQRWSTEQGGCAVVGADFPMEARFMADDGFHPGPLAYELWATSLARHIRVQQDRFSSLLPHVG